MSTVKLRPFTLFSIVILLVVAFLGYQIYQIYAQYLLEKEILKKIISRLEGDRRGAEAMVVDSFLDQNTGKQLTTVKFLEFDGQGKALAPKHFTFSGNLLQIQSLVVRFDDKFIRNGDALRGKSAALFWKIFYLDGKNTEEFELNKFNEIPEGYRIDGPVSPFERQFWHSFWKLALDPAYAKKMGVKNAQVEAPGTRFVPGMVYTLKIENDGGLRIDAAPIPEVLKGEMIK